MKSSPEEKIHCHENIFFSFSNDKHFVILYIILCYTFCHTLCSSFSIAHKDCLEQESMQALQILQIILSEHSSRKKALGLVSLLVIANNHENAEAHKVAAAKATKYQHII